ncbi:MAG: B12-binding domain-containing radical SAM protein [Promethearchaeota archaeon]
MVFNILLVNPNRFKDPPVIPIGLEYIASALEKYNYNVDILDLCFCEIQEDKLSNALDKISYDIVGFSIRNIDSLGYFNNEFFLPAIKPLVQCVKERNIPVVLGGSGFSAMPHEILDYLDGDYGIIGPGEIMFPRFLKLYESQKLTKKIYNGWQYGPDIELIHFRGSRIDYSMYLSKEEDIGFETHAGCSDKCPFCVSSYTKRWYKKIPHIIEEIKYLVDQGYKQFRSCDNEFNSDLNFSMKFCRALVKENFPIKWKLFMKPYPYNEELFSLLHESNAYLIALTVSSDKRIQNLNHYDYNHLKQIIEFCNKYQIELTVDLLVGFPDESLESVKNMISFFKTHRPTKISVDSYLRVYNYTKLANTIKNDTTLQRNLIKPYFESSSFLEPVFYNQFSQNILEKLISEDKLFKIAWTQDKSIC